MSNRRLSQVRSGLLLSLAVVLVCLACQNSPAKTDADRIDDVHALATIAEEFKQATGFYPLADVYVNVPVSVNLSNRRLPAHYQYPPRGQSGSVLTVKKFEEYLRKTLGPELEVPKDDRRLDELPLFYQYRFNGENYFVAAILDEATEATRTVNDLYEKYEVSSKAVAESKVQRFDAAMGRAVAPAERSLAPPIPRTAPSPGLPDRLAILDLLRARDFDGLEASLTELAAKARKDLRYEPALDIYLRTLGLGETWMQPYIEAWARSRPDSAWAQLARARHYRGMSYRARGQRWAAETKQSQFDAARRFAGRATISARRALELDAELLDPYVVMINIATGSADQRQCGSLAEQAFAIEPASYRVWHTLVLCSSRRWGGSQQDMARLAREAQGHVERNPRLAVLRGYADKDLGDDYRSAERYTEALEAYDRALEAGEHYLLYEARARAYFWLDRYEEAHADLTRALELSPQNANLLTDRVRVLAYLGRFAEMRADLEQAAKIEPTGPRVTLRQESKLYRRAGRKAYALYKEERYDDARKLMTEALEYDSDYAYGYFVLGLTHKDSDPKRALLYFEQSIEKNPEFYKPHEYVHWLRGKEGEWRRVLEMWNNYLALYPGKAVAYYKRSKANKKLRRRQAEIADLSEACGLGYEDACELLGLPDAQTQPPPKSPSRPGEDDVSRYGPQPSPRVAWQRFLEIQTLGITNPELDLFTDASKALLRKSRPGHGQAAIAKLYETARPDIRIRGDLAAVVFLEDRDYRLAPWFFRKERKGWQFDGGVLPELIGFNQKNQWFFKTADHPYAWAFEDYRIDENGWAKPPR